MMELKPCPVWNEGGLTYFGGPRANDAWYETAVGTLRILCEDCPNRRPIEDALAARVTELEAENARLLQEWAVSEAARTGAPMKSDADLRGVFAANKQLREALLGMLDMGIVLDDPQISYIEVQIDRAAIEAARAALEVQP